MPGVFTNGDKRRGRRYNKTCRFLAVAFLVYWYDGEGHPSYSFNRRIFHVALGPLLNLNRTESRSFCRGRVFDLSSCMRPE